MFTFSVYLIGPWANKLFIIQDKDKVSLPLLPPSFTGFTFKILNLWTQTCTGDPLSTTVTRDSTHRRIVAT